MKNLIDLDPKLREELEREIKAHLRRLHYVPGTNTSADIAQVAIEMVLSDTAKRIHQEGFISISEHERQMKELIKFMSKPKPVPSY